MVTVEKAENALVRNFYYPRALFPAIPGGDNAYWFELPGAMHSASTDHNGSEVIGTVGRQILSDIQQVINETKSIVRMVFFNPDKVMIELHFGVEWTPDLEEEICQLIRLAFLLPE